MMLPLQVTLGGRQVVDLLPDQMLAPWSPLNVARESLPSPRRLMITRCGQRLAHRRAWP